MRPLTVLASAALLTAAMPAQAEVVQSSDAGFIVRESVEVPAGVYESWATLVAPAKWWSGEHSWSGKAENLYIDSQATGCFCELMPVPEGAPEGTRRGSVEHMHLIHVNPGRVLRMAGALGPLQGEAVTGVLTITLKPTDKGTRILWEYVVGGYMRFKPAEIAGAVDKVLGEQITRLGTSLGAVTEPADAVGANAAEPSDDKTGGAEAAPKPAAPKARPKAKAKLSAELVAETPVAATEPPKE